MVSVLDKMAHKNRCLLSYCDIYFQNHPNLAIQTENSRFLQLYPGIRRWLVNIVHLSKTGEIAHCCVSLDKLTRTIYTVSTDFILVKPLHGPNVTFHTMWQCVWCDKRRPQGWRFLWLRWHRQKSAVIPIFTDIIHSQNLIHLPSNRCQQGVYFRVSDATRSHASLTPNAETYRFPVLFVQRLFTANCDRICDQWKQFRWLLVSERAKRLA